MKSRRKRKKKRRGAMQSFPTHLCAASSQEVKHKDPGVCEHGLPSKSALHAHAAKAAPAMPKRYRSCQLAVLHLASPATENRRCCHARTSAQRSVVAAAVAKDIDPIADNKHRSVMQSPKAEIVSRTALDHNSAAPLVVEHHSMAGVWFVES